MKRFMRILSLTVCCLMMCTLTPVVFASNNLTATMNDSVQEGETLVMTVSMKATDISSLGAVIACDSAFEIVSVRWLQSGLIADYDALNQKAVFAPASATVISGDILEVTVRAKTATPAAANVTVRLIAKNGENVVFDESISKSVIIDCTSHSFGAYTSGASEHSHACSKCGYVEKATHTWDAGEVTTEATCANQGTKTYTCTVCSGTKTESIPELGHKAGEWVTLPDGSQEQRCLSCGELLGTKPADDMELGDVNGDGKVNMFDYVMIKSIYLSKYTPSDLELARADVNSDGKVNMFDYIMVKQICIA